MSTISVVIPSFPLRRRLLMRALASVVAQTRLPDEIIVAVDHEGVGAARTRDRGLRTATGEWVAFLDDDDELLPRHLERLEQFAAETGADMVFPWFTVIGGIDPFPQHFGRIWTADDPTQTTITMMVRRDAALAVGGFLDGDEDEAGEDFRFVLRLAAAGYKIMHLQERLWRWHHHQANTSGRPWREVIRSDGTTDHKAIAVPA